MKKIKRRASKIIQKTPGKLVKVMIFGTFDGLHPGHLDFFRQAKMHGDFLVVSVARDTMVPQFKGRLPMFDERERLLLVKSCRFVDKAVLGDKRREDFYLHIADEAPAVICLGYDQWATEGEVRENLDKVGLTKTKIIRLKPYRDETHKSSKMKSAAWRKST